MNKLTLVISTWLLPIVCLAQETQSSEAVNVVAKDNSNQAIAIIVPIALFIFLLGIVFIVHYLRFRQSQELQNTIRIMIEKGSQVPTELLSPPEKNTKYQEDIRKGLILLFLGIAIPIAMVISQPENKGWVWGLIPLSIGLAYLISARLSKK